MNLRPSKREKSSTIFWSRKFNLCVNIDYCHKACGAPQTYMEAMNSPKAPRWGQAMKNELEVEMRRLIGKYRKSRLIGRFLNNRQSAYYRI